MKIGICGTGAFARTFIPLFATHPLVSNVVLCDLDAAKLAEQATRFGIDETCGSLAELCDSDVDAVALFTQNTLHGPQAVQAIRAGKNVYSAVPSAGSLEEITELVAAVEQTGRTYMVGETSYYYPSAIYCRERYRKGDFGHVVYAEAEYYHDMDLGLYEVNQRRFGADWKRYAGKPPMYYPTHSTSMIVSVTGAHVTSVSCLGYVDRHDDGLFVSDVNMWNNTFSNQTALCRMSDGSIARLNEFRRISTRGERVRIYGTHGSFEEESGHSAWADKEGGIADLATELINAPRSGQGAAEITDPTAHAGFARVQPAADLPREFLGLPNGHNGSHQFLVHEFVTSCATGALPPNNVWQAARYLVPGLIAHESSRRDGEQLPVPDFGDPPS